MSYIRQSGLPRPESAKKIPQPKKLIREDSINERSGRSTMSSFDTSLLDDNGLTAAQQKRAEMQRRIREKMAELED